MIELPHWSPASEAPGLPKLVAVIPALNEEATIGGVIAAVPRRILGIGEVEVIVVDDGSTDATRDVALAAGADRIVAHRRNRGLVASFNHGVAFALARAADVVVHLDADGQHDPSFIPELVGPILAGEADLVVGVRPLADPISGSFVRRHLNRLASWLFRRTFRMQVRDVTSGYRAFSREALLQLNVITDYTYTLESLIQAARKRLSVAEVSIPARRRAVGESRVTHSVRRYVNATGGQALRSALHSAPLAVFGRAALLMLLIAAGCTVWFLAGYANGGMHLPALLASVLAFVLSASLFISGLIADGINSNRRLLEDALYRIKRIEAEREAFVSGLTPAGERIYLQ
ncbi:MAG TPA: glycosyltransferase family 2 protein [Gaiellaceae bacterium]|nr:glycosyltransferase family 2 protein [Gaiellaceae bacterium]